jgi:hypothetical protein
VIAASLAETSRSALAGQIFYVRHVLRPTADTHFHRSGHLNAKQRELLELQAKAQARLAKARARFADGMQDAREVRADLEWTQKKVS